MEPTTSDPNPERSPELQDCLEPEQLAVDYLPGTGRLDLGRLGRRRLSEAVFAQGKTSDQVLSLAQRLIAAGQTVLVTRLSPDQQSVLELALPHGVSNRLARTFYCLAPGPTDFETRIAELSSGPILVACAGTADLPVAREALECLAAWRIPAKLVEDIGVAGLQRLVAAIPELRSASVIIAVAGMEATLPTAIAGLVHCPVIGVPTSVGYGAHLGGVAALLSMINSCAGGLTVVNIDNGFGGAMAAALILHQMAQAAHAAKIESRGNL